MATRILFVVLSVLLAGCQPNAQPTPAPTTTPQTQRPKLVAVGDSLTEGLGVDPDQAYPAQLERRLVAAGLDWEVVNAGESGETSSGALSRVDWILKSTKPQAVILATGANDGLRGVDPEITKQNLDAIVGKLKAANVKVLMAGMLAPPNLGAEYANKVKDAYSSVAEKHGVPLIPFILEGVAKVPELNQEDGKHPTAEGYTKIVDLIFEDVKTWLTKA